MFLLIIISETTAKDRKAELIVTLDECGKWLKVGAGIYLVHSAVEPRALEGRLRKQFGPLDNIWVTTVDVHGSLPPEIAQWVKARRNGHSDEAHPTQER